DSLRDLQAARVVAATPILVRTGKGQKTEARGQELEGVAIFDNLAAVADSLLSH
ncbi:MAG: D-glycero-D-manno-heptose 1 7-bisphosphate phosphatase, partial [Halothiobacillaceae bacterium]